MHPVLDGFIPTIFVGPWYNGMPAADSEDGLLTDRASALVGMARLRQLRVLNGKKDSKVKIRTLRVQVNTFDAYGFSYRGLVTCLGGET